MTSKFVNPVRRPEIERPGAIAEIGKNRKVETSKSRTVEQSKSRNIEQSNSRKVEPACPGPGAGAAVADDDDPLCDDGRGADGVAASGTRR